MYKSCSLGLQVFNYLTLLFPKKLMLHSLDQKVLAMSKPLHTVLEIIPNGSLVILEYEGES